MCLFGVSSQWFPSRHDTQFSRILGRNGFVPWGKTRPPNLSNRLKVLPCSCVSEDFRLIVLWLGTYTPPKEFNESSRVFVFQTSQEYICFFVHIWYSNIIPMAAIAFLSNQCQWHFTRQRTSYILCMTDLYLQIHTLIWKKYIYIYKSIPHTKGIPCQIWKLIFETLFFSC